MSHFRNDLTDEQVSEWLEGSPRTPFDYSIAGSTRIAATQMARYIAEKAAEWGAIQGLISLSNRMGSELHHYQLPEGCGVGQTEAIVYESLCELEQREKDCELHACCEWLKSHIDAGTYWALQLKEARRPRSLKQKALDDLKLAEDTESLPSFELIRKALESIPD